MWNKDPDEIKSEAEEIEESRDFFVKSLYFFLHQVSNSYQTQKKKNYVL